MIFAVSAIIAFAFVRRVGGLLPVILVAIPAKLDIGPSGITAFELSVPICLFAEMAARSRGSRRGSLPPHVIVVTVAAFFIATFASGLWAYDADLWLKRVVVLTEAIGAGLAVYLAARRLGSAKFISVLAWSSAVGAAWSVTWFYFLGRPVSLNLQPPTGPDSILSQSLRLGSPMIGPSNYYAGFLVATIPITFYWSMRKPSRWPLAFIQILAFVGTVSRGGIVALALATALVLALRQLHKRTLPHPLTVVGGGLMGFALVPLVPRAVDAFLTQRQETTLAGASASSRLELWHEALRLWPEHPYLGVGAGNWSTVAGVEHASGAHNALLQILVELGLAGLLLAVFAALAIGGALLRGADEGVRYAIYAGFLGAFIDSMTEAQFEGAVFTWFLGVYLGGALAVSALTSERAPWAAGSMVPPSGRGNGPRVRPTFVDRSSPASTPSWSVQLPRAGGGRGLP